ncbi:MAG: glycosyl hydrolase family 65 protein, partial [Solirubrobacteraceae bacterium]
RADRPGSWELFTQALESDIGDVQGGTTAEGVHLGAMAGTVDLAIRGYAGIEAREDALWLNPSLPREAGRLCFSIRYRSHWGIRIEIGDGRLRVTVPASSAPPITIAYEGTRTTLRPGEVFDRPLPRRSRRGPA